MHYLDGFVAPVADGKRERYVAFAKEMAAVFIEHGALEVVDAWADDVPDGKLTSFPLSVKLEAGESVVFGWIVWPSKAAHDDGWGKAMQDPRMSGADMQSVFDGKRMIFGRFDVVQASRAEDDGGA